MVERKERERPLEHDMQWERGVEPNSSWRRPICISTSLNVYGSKGVKRKGLKCRHTDIQ